MTKAGFAGVTLREEIAGELKNRAQKQGVGISKVIESLLQQEDNGLKLELEDIREIVRQEIREALEEFRR